VIGVPATAAFDEVHAAWRQKLAEYHPDRFTRAGEKIRKLASSETQRLNAAYQAIARARGSRSRH
jgi:DnaJ-domain-containing protein 1